MSYHLCRTWPNRWFSGVCLIRNGTISLLVVIIASPFQGTASGDEPLHGVYTVGVAKIDITPNYPVRLSGFGVRRTESEGVRQRIWAKALAIDDGQPAILITVDNLGIPAYLVDQVAGRLAEKVKRDRFAITATHTHTAPMLKNVCPTLFGLPIPPEHQKHIDRYTTELADRLEKVALEALADRQSSRLEWAIGSVKFAVNRRKPTPSGIALDKNPKGPVDHDLPVLVVRDLIGKVRAVYVSYACHCVTLSDDKISGDWAGYAQDQIQDGFPGAVALVSIGCGGDSNPSSGVTGDQAEIAARQGAEIAAEVKRLLANPLTSIQGKITTARRTLELPLADPPSRGEWEERAKRNDAIGYHARVQLGRLENGESLRTKIPYPIQTWAFGDSVALVFLPGEVVVDYSLRLKREFDRRRIWINAYANDAPCYIPSERILQEGGYEGRDAMVYYDLPGPFKPGLEDRIIGAIHEQIGQRFGEKKDN
jgi:hypothetical protein